MAGSLQQPCQRNSIWDARQHRLEGSGRIAKRRAFELRSNWDLPGQENHPNAATASFERPLLKKRGLPDAPPSARPVQPCVIECQPQAAHCPQTEEARTTSVTTLIPTEVSNRRNQLDRRHGTGRATQLRSFTLQLTLPAKASPPQPQALQLSPLALSAAQLIQASPMSAVQLIQASPMSAAQRIQVSFMSAAQRIQASPMSDAELIQTSLISAAQLIQASPMSAAQRIYVSPASAAHPIQTYPMPAAQIVRTSPMSAAQLVQVPPMSAAQLIQGSPMSAAQLIEAPSMLISPGESAPSSCSSFRPFFLKAGTPIEGIPEWLSNSKTPSASAVAPAGSASNTAATPGLAFTPIEGVPERPITGRQLKLQQQEQPEQQASVLQRFSMTPMEGVPERTLPFLQTSSRLARLARLPMWEPGMGQQEQASHTPLGMHPPSMAGQQEQQSELSTAAATARAPAEKEEQLIHRAGDDILRSEPASPEESADEREDNDYGNMSGHPQGEAGGSRLNTPFAKVVTPGFQPPQQREIEVQTGASLFKGHNQEVFDYEPCVGHYENSLPQDQEQDHEDGPDATAHANSDVEKLLNTENDNLDGQKDTAVDDQSPAEPEVVVTQKKKSHGGHVKKRSLRSRTSLAGDGLAMDLHGKRMSTRGHQRPLEYWRNEHKVFGRDHKTMPTVVRVETRTPNPSWPLTDKTNKLKKRARTRP